MKKAALLLVLVFLMGCTVSSNQETAEQGSVVSSIEWVYDMEAAKEMAMTEDKPMLVDFYTEWCGWCKKLDKDTYADPKVQEQLKQFICIKIDAEKNRELSRQFNISGFPSTAFLRSDGQLVEVVPGYLPPEDFLMLLKEMLKKTE